jgi:MATE family multidrug resistance protein|eukprot:COSAG01_NODE_2134_length_8347_cov_43.066319_11_plen_454_part_00
MSDNSDDEEAQGLLAPQGGPSDKQLDETNPLVAPPAAKSSKRDSLGSSSSSPNKGKGAALDDEGEPTLYTEFSTLAGLAWPLSLTFGLQQASQQVNVMFVGQLGPTELGAVVLATMWANISGTSIAMGGMTALDSLASQAFGAGEYHLVGILLQRCIYIVTLLCFPIYIVWWFATKPLLVHLLNVEEDVAEMSEKYIHVLVLYLWPQLMQRAMISILRCQGIVRPTTVITGLASAINIPTTYYLVKTYGFDGAPWAQVFSGWMQLTMMLIACRWRGYLDRCWGGWTRESLTGWGPMVKLGFAGTVSLMGEWWSWEMASGMAAVLGTVPLAAHAVLLNLGFIYFVFPYGISRAVGIRIGQLLGAGRGDRARMALRTALLMAAFMIAIAITLLNFLRRQVAGLYSEDPAVLDMASKTMTIYFNHMAWTGLNFTLQGAMGGCGRQQLMARVSLFSW